MSGEDLSELYALTQIKSMLSAKSFRPTINSSEQAVRWLRIFVADIMSRLVEEGVLENKRRPKTLNLHHRQGAQMRSRQAPIPTGRSIDEALLFDIAKNLLGQIVVDGRAWPCSNLQLSVGGFEDGPSGNRGIGSFLVKGEEVRAITPSAVEPNGSDSIKDDDISGKRRRLNDGGIQRFFLKHEISSEDLVEHNDPNDDVENPIAKPHDYLSEHESKKVQPHGNNYQSSAPQQQTAIDSYFCDRCSKNVATKAKAEHDDWHFARDLQLQEQVPQSSKADTHALPGLKKPQVSKSGNVSAYKKFEKGQSRLAFGTKPG